MEEKNLIEIEQSIIKKYRKSIWRKFTKAINEYDLIKENDIIGICISGGKDSFLLAKCFQEIKKHGKINFDIKFLCMDPGYNLENKAKIKDISNKLGIDINIFETDVFKVASKLNKNNPCYICARMRRGYLYDYAKSLGCNKIALGHHFDDVIETILMSMFYNGRIQTMLPKLKSSNFDNMELIRPLYLIKEEDIKAWASYNNIEFIGCACGLEKENSKRLETKKFIKKLRNKDELIDLNIFKSVDNVNLEQILGYHANDEYHSYIENYDKN